MRVRCLFQSWHLRWAWRAALLKHSQRGHQGAWRWTHSGGGPYRAVIFDMGGVLIPSPGRVAAEWEVHNHVPSGTILKAFVSGGENGPWMRFMRGEMAVEAFLPEFGRLCSEISETCVPVDSFFSLLTSEQVAKQFPVMTEAITRIRARGLQTAVLSNNFYLSNGKSFLPLDRKQFDVVVESCLEGVSKPDPRIYKLCLERLGVQPSESIFLDDLGQNLRAAASLGMHTVKVNDPEAAVKELETLLGFALRTVVPNTHPVRNTMEIPRDSLEKYLKDLLGTQTTGPMELLQFDHGQSNSTYCIRLADRLLVLKKKPPGTCLPSAHAVERELRIMKTLVDSGVPVPKVLDLCEDSRIIGTPFYLMEYCPGLVYTDPALPGLEPSQRRAIYTAMNRVLCKIHSVDPKAAGLGGGGKPGDYILHQVQTWIKQYRASETGTIPAMERLIEWLPLHLPRPQKITVVHGDFRLDKLLFHPEKTEVLAVFDWELSALGDPLADVAYSCMAHYLPPEFPTLPGLGGRELTPLGIPTAEEYFRMYCLHMGIPPIETWNFYMAFSFFRMAAIQQGVSKHSLTGQASLAAATQSRKLAELLSDLAWEFAVKEGFRIFNKMPATQPARATESPGLSGETDPFPAGRRSQVSFSAPDTGNLELLVLYGTEEQKACWPAPLLEGKVRSCFAMTGPQVPPRDSLSGQTLARPHGVRHTWNAGPLAIRILDPRCRLCVFMGKTDLYAPRHWQQSVLWAPVDTLGVEVILPLMVYRLEDAPGGPGEVLSEQAKSRVALGKALVGEGTILEDVSQLRMEIEQAWLLVRRTAHLMDVAGNMAAALDVAMIKVAAPSVAYRVADHVVQDFGPARPSSDCAPAQFFAWAHALRFANGPGEVHRVVVAKMELKHHM